MIKLLISLYKILYKIAAPIRNNAAFFCFMFALFYVCSQMEVPDIKGYKPYTYAGQEIFTDLYMICIFLMLFPQKIRRWARGIFYVIVYPIVIVDVFCFVKFDSTISPTIILLLGETNSSEASEFMSSYLSADVLISPVGVTLLIALLHIIYNIVKSFVFTNKEPELTDCQSDDSVETSSEKTQLRPRRHITKRPVFWASWLKDKVFIRILPSNATKIYVAATNIFFALMIIYVIGAYYKEMWTNKSAICRLFSYNTIGEVEHELTRKDKAQLYVAPQRLAFSIYSNRLAATQIEKLISEISNIKIDSCSYRSKNIVLIIGESCNRRHFQLYGYEKPTTPLQVEMEKTGQLVPFSDVIAPWNLTSFVFKHILSLYAVGDKGEWCDYPLFPELFRKANYQVAFITNQFLPQAKEEVYDFSGGFFLNNPILTKAQFDIRNNELHQFDEGILHDYDKLVAPTFDRQQAEGKGTLTIIHLKGQHTLYGQRYPLKTRRKFRYNEYTDKLSRRHRYIQADYDNATVYNDSIVHQVVKRFEDKDAIVIYMPDHGDECYLNDKPILGRNHSAHITYDLAQEEFHIPFWIWCSKPYIKAHPDVFKKVREVKDKPFMTDNISQMLLWLAGIECPWTRNEANPLSDEYDEKRPRVIKNTVDYNTLTK